VHHLPERRSCPGTVRIVALSGGSQSPLRV
jgi:hypothetical protein